MEVRYRKIKAKYIDHMGDDLSVVNAARVSFSKTKDEFDDKKDVKLLNYLAEHKHGTPFEHTALTIHITCPLYIRSQIMRHRSMSFNEVSRRYTSEDISFYIPPIRKQHKKSKQCSDGAADEEAIAYAEVAHERLIRESLEAYNGMIEKGVAREIARGILPQCMNTEFYMTGNLRSWAHFLSLRLDSHAQEEVVILSKQIKNIIKDKFPNSYEALINNL